MSQRKLKTKVVAQLRAVRKARGLSQDRLAEKLGYSHKTVRGWEQGRGLPTMRNLLNWCAGLGVELTIREADHV